MCNVLHTFLITHTSQNSTNSSLSGNRVQLSNPHIEYNANITNMLVLDAGFTSRSHQTHSEVDFNKLLESEPTMVLPKHPRRNSLVFLMGNLFFFIQFIFNLFNLDLQKLNLLFILASVGRVGLLSVG